MREERVRNKALCMSSAKFQKTELHTSHKLHKSREQSNQVLLLNASFEPLTAISVRRAIVLLLRERADVIYDDPQGKWFSSEHQSLPSPLVIKLRYYVKIPYQKSIPLTRTALMQRDNFKCGYCGNKADTIDHVVPRSRGGSHSWENCVASCVRCNQRKADKLLSEMGWTLHTHLAPPREKYWLLLSTVKEIHPLWRVYLTSSVAKVDVYLGI